MRRCMVAVAAAIALAACGASVTATAQSGRVDEKVAKKAEKEYKPSVSVDPFTKAKSTDVTLVRSVYGDRVKCATTKDVHPVMAVALRRYEAGGQPPLLFLFTYYVASDWIFISRGAPLQVLVGDSLLSMPQLQEPSRDVGRTGTVQEMGAYTMAPDQLAAIAVADSVVVRVAGDKGHCDFAIGAEGQYLARLFAVRAMGDSTLASTVAP